MASRKRSLPNDAEVSALFKEWDEASCPICMDHPHNAVLLICSSHSKGCRSYICDTSYRHSNCLDRFKKLKEENAEGFSAPTLTSGGHHISVYTADPNMDSSASVDMTRDSMVHTISENNSAAFVEVAGGSGTHHVHHNLEEQGGALWESLDFGENDMEKAEEGSNLRCPLCRGHIFGWKVVEEARKYLNSKSRSCSHESCSFFGDYRELRRHARRVHPTVRPADVDPTRQRDWHRLENQREYNDVVSAIRSAMPGAIVLGDYVIETGDRLSGERDRFGGSGDGGRLLSTLFLFQMIGSMDPRGELRGGRSRILPRHRRPPGTFSRRRYLWGDNLLGPQDDEDEDEPDLNMLSHLGDDMPARRRRRLSRSRSDDEQP